MESLSSTIKYESTRLKFIVDDLPKAEDRISNNKNDLTILNARMNALIPDLNEEKLKLDEVNVMITDLNDKVQKIENKMFKKLASTLNTTVSNIRAIHLDALSSSCL